ncbi:hypothetical protein [Microvirga terricola]|uniref:Uncharacterized protein n=1 Tax=Microvirga terricola TaxID=2719797 RepID=A0ABX0VCZ2_9HYPH|nr:hypothetical protein [Microvirga terricola]NIX77709.1 hypothetical protein [Microvirga terricola]
MRPSILAYAGAMSRPPKLVAALAALTVTAIASGFPLATAQESKSPSWPEVKCARYKKAWTDALAVRGTKGLGREFLDNHETFLASGCTDRPPVCPQTDEEFALANMMVVAAMNAGTASTFPPFSCRKGG